MNQGKLEVVKQEMARVNISILGICELKQSGMGEFNSNDHNIYYCGQESLRRNGVALVVNKRVQNTLLGYNQKELGYKEKKCKKAKWLSEKALQTAKERRKAKGKGRKERHTHLNAEIQRLGRR